MIAGNHHDADPGPSAFLDGVRHLTVWRVHHGDESEERQALFEGIGFQFINAAFHFTHGQGEHAVRLPREGLALCQNLFPSVGGEFRGG